MYSGGCGSGILRTPTDVAKTVIKLRFLAVEARETPQAILAMNAMRADQNMALQTEDWEYAAETQTAINVVLNDRSGGENPDVMNEIHKTFHRLYRRARNDGRHNHAARYKRYAENMAAAIGN